MKTPPILVDLPRELRTPRLVIRPPFPGTGARLNEAVLESLESLRPWMIWAQRPPTVDENEAWIREVAAEYLTRRAMHMHMWCRETGEFVGGVGFHRVVWSVPCMEHGYWCRDAFVGRGLVTEAVRYLTAWVFEELEAERVEIRCDARNVRSIAVAERAGFRREAVLRRSLRGVDGTLRDTLVFARFREDHDGGAIRFERVEEGVLDCYEGAP